MSFPFSQVSVHLAHLLLLVAIDELRNLKDALGIGDERDDVVDMAAVFYEVCLVFLHIDLSRFLHYQTLFVF